MATVSQENIGTHHEKVKITLSKGDYQPVFQASLKKQSKLANIPGFRKGMVPPGMLKKMYGPGIFQEEMIRLAGLELEKFLIENNIEFLARPLPSESHAQLALDMDSDKDYLFEYEFAAVPSMNISLFDKKEKWPQYKVNVTDEMVQEEVERFRYKAGNMTEPESVTQEDNVLNLSFIASDENGVANDEVAPKENSLLLKYFTKKAQEAFMGKKASDQITMKLNEAINDDVLPAIMKDIELDPAMEEHKEKYYTFRIDKVGLVEKPELNETFFKQIYPMFELNTEEEFRKKVKEDIQQYWDGQAKNFLHNEMYERLVHETDMELPDTFLKRWLLMTEEKYKSMDEVEAAYNGFTHSIRWELIMKKLVEENNIDVSREEIEGAVKMQLQNYFGGQTLDDGADWVQGFINKQMQDRDTYEKTYRQVLSDKLFHFLEAKLEKEEKNIGVEEFIKLPHAHHHHH